MGKQRPVDVTGFCKTRLKCTPAATAAAAAAALGEFFFYVMAEMNALLRVFLQGKKYDDKLHGFPMLRTSLYVISVDVIALKLKIVLHLKALSSQLIVRISVHVIRFKLSEFIN